MDAIAARSPVREGRVAPLLDARKNKVYFCAYELAQGKPVRITEYMLGNIKEVLEGIDEDVIFLGDGVDKYINELKGAGKARYIPDADWYPRAGYLAEAALELYEQEGKGQDPETVEPLYLHPRDCNITGKNKNGRKV
jgi:tRNA A37 threonylcarbamoyladenosine modification protein TsaB